MNNKHPNFASITANQIDHLNKLIPQLQALDQKDDR
jgi:hypothetical protein